MEQPDMSLRGVIKSFLWTSWCYTKLTLSNLRYEVKRAVKDIISTISEMYLLSKAEYTVIKYYKARKHKHITLTEKKDTNVKPLSVNQP